jgi:ketosteroid isomerase-like protein
MGWEIVLVMMALYVSRLLILASAAAFSSSAASPAAEEKAIRQVLANQQDAWNRGDIEKFMEGYENSASITFLGAALTRGYRPVLDSYIKRYPAPDAMGKLTFSELEVNPIGDGHAWMLGRFHLERTAAGGGGKSGRFTLILKKTKTGWKVVHDHTS